MRDVESLPVDGRVDLTGGVTVSYRFREALAFRVDVLYARKRFSSSDFVTDTPVDSRWVDVPFLADFVVRPRSRFRPTLVVGFQFGAKLRATRQFRGEEQDIEDELADDDFGLVGGGEVSVLPNSDRLTVEGRLHWGLRNIDRTRWYDIKSRTLTLLVGYSF